MLNYYLIYPIIIAPEKKEGKPPSNLFCGKSTGRKKKKKGSQHQ